MEGETGLEKNISRRIIIISFNLAISACIIYFPYNLRNQARNNNQVYNTVNIENGDIIFQTSLSSQSKAIEKATGSKFTHCGIIYKINNQHFVYEAIQPVQLTPLKKWIQRGKDGHFVIKRLKNARNVLTPQIIKRMKEEGERFRGKNYDLTFEWSDNKIYCSELIWKIYKKGADIEIVSLSKLKDFRLDDPMVKKKLYERYGNQIPLEEPVISPEAIYNSNLLIEIK